MAEDPSRNAPSFDPDEVPSEDLHRTVEELIQDADVLMQSISSALHDIVGIAQQIEEPEPLLSLLYGLRSVKGEISNREKTGAYDRIEAEVFPVMGEQKLVVAPFGEFVSHRGMNRKGWKYADLVPVLVARALDERTFDPETGEATEREAETVARVLLDCLSLSGAKVKALRARGITPSEFCEEEPKAWSLQLPKKVGSDDLDDFGDDEREVA